MTARPYEGLYDDLAASNRDATALYLTGWEDGYGAGYAAAVAESERLADLAARRFYAMDAEEAARRAYIAGTVRDMEAAAARARQGVSA